MSEAAAAPRVVRADLAALSGGAPILVLAPHPDDETLGCGALLAAAFAGPGAHVVCMTDGSASHPGSRLWPPARLARCRAAELDAALAELGGGPGDVTRLSLPDAGMSATGPEAAGVVDRLCALGARLGAGSVFAPAGTDPHCDHVATDALARQVAERLGCRQFSYPIWSRWADPGFRARLDHETEHCFDAAPERARKARAIACHRSQLGAVVTDDPDGFVMEEAFVALLCTGDELFFERCAS